MSDTTDRPAGYASDPTIAVIWAAPPIFDGHSIADASAQKNGQGSGGATTGGPGGNSDTFSVTFATLQAAESALLAACQQLCASYNPLEQAVQQDIANPNFFGQQATYNMLYMNDTQTGNNKPAPYNDPFGQGNQSGMKTEPDTGLQQGAQQYAGQIMPAMTRVLRMIADATEAVGIFTAMINNSGQAYTYTDKNSCIPLPQGY